MNFMKENAAKKISAGVLATFLGMGIGYCGTVFGQELNFSSFNEIKTGELISESPFTGKIFEAIDEENNKVGIINVLEDNSSNIKVSGYEMFLEKESGNNIIININDGLLNDIDSTQIHYLSNVYGGYIRNNENTDYALIEENNVNINGNNKKISISELCGGKFFYNTGELQGDVRNNTLSISNVTFSKFQNNNEDLEDLIENDSKDCFYGGRALQNVAVNDNKVSITNTRFEADDNYIYGGDGQFGEVSGNKIQISESVIEGNAEIYGGNTSHLTADGNSIKVSGCKFEEKADIYGAYTSMSNSENNTVNISESSFGNKTSIYGAYIKNSDYASVENFGSAVGNKVIIEGKIENEFITNIYGGYIYYRVQNTGTDTIGKLVDNSIELKNTFDANLDNVNLYGYGYDIYLSDNDKFDGKNKGEIYNNNLTIDNWTGNVNSINNFNNIEFKTINWEKDGTVLNITGGNFTDLANTGIKVDNETNLVFSGGYEFTPGESMTLVKNAAGIDGVADLNDTFTASAGVAGEVSGIITGSQDSVDMTIEKIGLNNQVELVAENRAVAAAFVNQGTDLINDSLAVLSRDGKYGVKTFAAVHGNRSKYDVNSDLKINGWSSIVGVGNEKNIGNGDFSWGVFYENGSGNYRTYNEFNNEFFRGDGSLVYNGGGIAARFEQDNGVYTEGSLRAGMLKSEMTNALKDGAGNSYGYKSESTYYGAHLGVGKIISLNEATDLDVYGKFFHTYTDGDSFTVANDKFEFDSITSDRLRIGARLTTNKENKFSTYYGLAYEYEFNGDADMRAQNMSVPEQSLKGSSCMAEIGMNYKPSSESPWSFDLSMRGYAGQRDGFSGNVQATYTF